MGWLSRLLGLSYQDTVVVLGASALGLSAGVLGTFAVLRQRSLVGDALSHAALPGVAFAFLLTGVKSTSALLIGAAAAGVVGALLMVGIERTSRIRPDAAIGVVLSSFFSLGIVLITHIGHTNNASQAGLEKFIFGQAAGLLVGDVLLMGILCAVSLTIVAVGFRALKTTLLDPGFAKSAGLPVRWIEIGTTALLVVAIVVGLRTVGAILMVAMLVAPSVTARQFANRLSIVLPLAGAIGIAVGVSGSLLSSAAAVPTGPVIVIVAFGVVVAAVLLAPGHGVLWRARKLTRDRRHALEDGVLLDTGDGYIAEGEPPARRRARRRLERGGLITDGRLTPAGELRFAEIAEGRRLWSLWLEHGWRVSIPDAREPDPRNLRGSLGDRAVRELLELGS